MLQSPAKNVISALKSGGGKIAGLVKTLKEKPTIEEPVKEEPKTKKKNEPKDEDS